VGGVEIGRREKEVRKVESYKIGKGGRRRPHILCGLCEQIEGTFRRLGWDNLVLFDWTPRARDT